MEPRACRSLGHLQGCRYRADLIRLAGFVEFFMVTCRVCIGFARVDIGFLDLQGL